MSADTPPVATWVVGAGGLLGASVQRVLSFPTRSRGDGGPSRDLPWHDPQACARALADAADAFFERAAGRPWSVLWCAGAGVVGVSEEALARETEILSALLDALASRRDERAAGALFFASSAGGVYAGSTALACDEETPCRPISPYGRAKLAQEALIERWSAGRSNVSTFVGRFSNLYGPGQNLHKAQGLISQLCRSMILGRPAHVYVPLDTRRDYLFVDDAAAAIARGMERLHREAAHEDRPVHLRKVLASERETSIASLLAILRRIARRPVRVVLAPSPAARLQPHAVRLRSTVWRDLMPEPQTPLAVGVHRIWQHQLKLLRRGSLPLPSPRLEPAPARST